MSFVGIIPARYASSRFPGKPLVMIQGMSMIERVYKQACQASSLSSVCVATDDERIRSEVERFGGRVIMTSPQHASGTDRCCEAAEKLNLPEGTVVLNIQGDEPFLQPEQIDLLCGAFGHDATVIATLVKKIVHPEELTNHNTPKVILRKDHTALYFSRSPIPHFRAQPVSEWIKHEVYHKHIGLYAFRLKTLKEITRLPISRLEKMEALEQLRWLENGYTIHTRETELETLAIDTPEDLNRI